MIDITTWFIKILIWPTAVILLLYLYSSRKYGYWKKRGIWYKKPSAFFGNFKGVFTFKHSIGSAFCDMHLETKTPYVGIFMLDKPALLIKNCDVIKSILITDFNNFFDRDVGSDLGQDSLGSQILFFMKNPVWKIYRKKMTQAFSAAKIKFMYGLISDAGKCLVDFISRNTEENNIIDSKEIGIAYTTEVITSALFGVEAKCIENKNSDFRVAASRIFDFNNLERAFASTCYLVAPKLAKLFRLKFLDAKSSAFLGRAFSNIIKHREETKIVRNDFIDIIIDMKKDDSKFLDDEKLLAQGVMFFIAGYETTSTVIAFALYELAKHPDIQNKLRNELASALRTKSDFFDHDMINKNLKYLDMVFKEALRKYPSLPYLLRECAGNYTIPGTGDVIEKGVPIYISLLGLHMDPNNFPNPEKFDPDRFSEENLKNIKAYSYLPFGDGPRNCIGERFGALSGKCAIANIIMNFKVDFSKDTPTKIDFHSRGITLAPRTGQLPLRFTKIE